MSKRKKKLLLMAFFVFVLGVVFTDKILIKNIRVEILTPRPYGSDAEKYHKKKFTVTNVVDGDTVDIGIPDGKYSTTRIRLLGVDTPETKKANSPVMYFGPEATAYAEKMLLGKDVVVIIDTVSDSRDRYQRLLAYLQIADGRVFNEEIIRNGFGYADLRFQHSMFSSYAGLQDQAISEKTGLWAKVTIEDIPGWLIREKPDIKQQLTGKGGGSSTGR